MGRAFSRLSALSTVPVIVMALAGLATESAASAGDGSRAATGLTLQTPRILCLGVSIGRTGVVCLAQPSSGRTIDVPGAMSWDATLTLRFAGGAPVSRAQVQILDGSGVSTVLTDSGGSASFTVPPGRTRSIRVVFPGSNNWGPSAAGVRIVNKPVSMIHLTQSSDPGRIGLAGVAENSRGHRTRLRIEVQLQRNDKWTTIARARSASNGWWHTPAPRPKSGRFLLRTVISHTPSQPFSFTLR